MTNLLFAVRRCRNPRQGRGGTDTKAGRPYAIYAKPAPLSTWRQLGRQESLKVIVSKQIQQDGRGSLVMWRGAACQAARQLFLSEED
jgi:hypothetical protein